MILKKAVTRKLKARLAELALPSDDLHSHLLPRECVASGCLLPAQNLMMVNFQARVFLHNCESEIPPSKDQLFLHLQQMKIASFTMYACLKS